MDIKMSMGLKTTESRTRNIKVNTNLIQQAPIGKAQHLNEEVRRGEVQAEPKIRK